jgi:hypothetical protein
MTRVPPAFRYVYLGLFLSGTALALGAGLQVARTSGHGSAPSSVQEAMDQLIDPAADALWASVGTEETVHGSHLHVPRTDAQWLKVAGYAQLLVDGAKRLQAPGLPVGANAHSRLADANTPGIRTAIQIRADIDADPARFRAAAIRLEDASVQALTAARSHNVSGLLDAGAALDAACESCHAAYWYPRTPPLRLPSPEEFATKANRP